MTGGCIALVYCADKYSFTSMSFGVETECRIAIAFKEPINLDIAVRDYFAPFNPFLSFCMKAR